MTDDLAGLRTEARPPAVGDRHHRGGRRVPHPGARDRPPSHRSRRDHAGLRHRGRLSWHGDRAPARCRRGPGLGGAPSSRSARRGASPSDLAVATGVEFQGDFFTLGDDFLTNDDGRRTTILRSLRLGDTELVDDDWTVTGAENLSDEEKGIVERTDDGALRVTTNLAGGVRALPESLARPPRCSRPSGSPSAREARSCPARAATRARPRSPPSCPALPLVGGAGVLGDLPAALYGSGPTVPAAQVMVLGGRGHARQRAGPAAPSRWHGANARGDRVRRPPETGAVTAWAYAVMAGCCLAVALLAMAARRRASGRRTAPTSPPCAWSASRPGRSARPASASWCCWPASPSSPAPPPACWRPDCSSTPSRWRRCRSSRSRWRRRPRSCPPSASACCSPLIVAVVAGRGRRLDLDDTRPAILRDEQAVELAAPAVAR